MSDDTCPTCRGNGEIFRTFCNCFGGNCPCPGVEIPCPDCVEDDDWWPMDRLDIEIERHERNGRGSRI